MKTTLKIYRDYLAEQVLILLFSHQYGANNFNISPDNIAKMGELMDVPDEELVKVREYCLEMLEKKCIPGIQRYRGKYVFINDYLVGWDHPTEEIPKNTSILLMRKLVGDPGIPNGQRHLFSVILHLTLQDFADQIWDEWQQTGQWKEILKQVGKPADRIGKLKLSKKQRELLTRLLNEAYARKKNDSLWDVPIPWNSQKFLPGTPSSNATRMLNELKRRRLIDKHVSPGGRTSHVSLTPTGTAIAESLQIHMPEN